AGALLRKRARKPRPKPARSIRLLLPPLAGAPGLVEITCGKLACRYWLVPLASDYSRAFRLDKFGGDGRESYAACLGGPQSVCERPGHTDHGHCKHCDGLQALVDHSKL